MRQRYHRVSGAATVAAIEAYHAWAQALALRDPSDFGLQAGAGRARAGYGIDFGVLADGRTALVEMNDGYGLGSYALDPDLYTDLLVARWEELMA
ncbi:MAG: ATP-grasp domain-containing protein [Acidobacteriota bacterium]